MLEPKHQSRTQELPDFGFPPAQHLGFQMNQHEVIDVTNVIQLKDPGADLAVPSRIPQVALESPGRCVSALALPAGIRIADEAGLELRFEQRMEQVMNDPVAEERLMDFARLWLVGDEDPARPAQLSAERSSAGGQALDQGVVPHHTSGEFTFLARSPTRRRSTSTSSRPATCR